MKIRTDFVTNSSSSSFCVEITVSTDDNKSYSLRVDPHEIRSGSDSLIHLNKNNINKLCDVKDIPSLCNELIELIDMDDDYEGILDSNSEEAEEAGIDLKTLWNTKNNMEAFKLLRKLGFDGLYDDTQKFIKKIKGISDISKIKEIILTEENYAWGEFAASNFGGLFEGIVPKNAEWSDDELILEKLKGKYPPETDFMGILGALKNEGPDQYDSFEKTIIDMQSRKSRTEYVIDLLAGTGNKISEEEETCDDNESANGPFKIKNGILIKYEGEDNDVVIPDGVISIGDFAFSDCANLESISIPDSVTSIGVGVFSECERLSNVSLPKAITRIENNLFQWCKSLKGINIPESVKEIGSSAFYGTKLKEIVIPHGVNLIEDNAFANCHELSSIDISEDVSVIGHAVFSNCENLTSFTIPQGLTEISGSTFVGCKGLVCVTIPKSVKKIGSSAFSGCEVLENIEIPEGVTKIESEAFRGCKKLKSISVPSTVKRIGKFAFLDCKNLRKVNFAGKIPQMDYEPFKGCNRLDKSFLAGK